MGKRETWGEFWGRTARRRAAAAAHAGLAPQHPAAGGSPGGREPALRRERGGPAHRAVERLGRPRFGRPFAWGFPLKPTGETDMNMSRQDLLRSM